VEFDATATGMSMTYTSTTPPDHRANALRAED
jgi:hypothetical protein